MPPDVLTITILGYLVTVQFGAESKAMYTLVNCSESELRRRLVLASSLKAPGAAIKPEV